MFVPLPVPFVFQRSAPDLNAWRLKSPLALRSNSGKPFSLLSDPISSRVGLGRTGAAMQPCYNIQSAPLKTRRAHQHTYTLLLTTHVQHLLVP